MNSTRSSSDTLSSFQATLINAGYGQLVLRDPIGKVSQKWTLAQPKCVLGAAENCTIRCKLPGITEHHLLLIVGAKQLFLRSMAPGLMVHGKAVSEVVIGCDPHTAAEREIEFELSGHRFQYLRSPLKTPVTKAEDATADVSQLVESHFAVQGLEPSVVNAVGNYGTPNVTSRSAQARSSQTRDKVNSDKANSDKATDEKLTGDTPDNRPQPGQRMRFTFVRALEKSRYDSQADQAGVDGSNATKPMWVEEIVRDALRPVEAQLDEITGPLQNLERQMRQQLVRQRRQRKLKQARQQRKSEAAPVEPPLPGRELLESQESIQRIVADQAERLAEVNRHVSAIMSQIATIERTIAQESDQHQTIVNTTNRSGQEIMRLQREMLEAVAQLQSQVAQPETTRDDELQWRASVEKQLEELHTSLAVLNEIKLDLHQAIDQSRELSQEWESHWQTIEEVARRPVVIQQPVPQPAPQPMPFQPQAGAEPTNYSADSITPYVSPTISFDATPLVSPLPAPIAPLPAPIASMPAPIAPMPAPIAPQPPVGVDAYHYAALQYQPDIRDDEGLNEPAVTPPVAESSGMQTESVLDRVAVREPVQLPDWWKDDSVSDSPAASAMMSDPVDSSAAPHSSAARGLENYFSSKYFPSANHPTHTDEVVDHLPGLAEQPSAADDYAISAFSEEHLSIAEPQALPPNAYAQPSQYPTAQDQQAYDQQAYDQQAYDQQAYQQQAYEQPAYQQPEYQQPEYQQPAYEQPAYEQPAYEQPAYEQQAPVDDNPYIRPSFGQTAELPYAAQPQQQSFEQQSFEQPQYEQPHYEQPPYQQELHQQAQYDDAPLAYGGPADALMPGDVYSETSDSGYSGLDAEDLIDELPAEIDDRYEADRGDAGLNGFGQREMPTAFGQSGAATDYNTQSFQAAREQATRPFAAQEQPTVSATSTGHQQSHSGEEDGGDESVEDYMRRLLARMRGVSESEVTLPGLDTNVGNAKEPSAVANQSADRSAASVQDQEPMSEAWTEPFDPDKYVPRGSAPEKNRDLNALRELANNSARSAIQVSARRRQGSAILIKSTVALVGLIAGFAIISINGARINIAFIATIASFLVAVIWGYDTLTSIRPLLQEMRTPKSKESTPTE